MHLLTPCGKDVNIMHNHMAKLTIKTLTLTILLCVSYMISGCGASSDVSTDSDTPYVTPINKNDPKSLQGTYAIDSASVSCSDGSSYSSSSPSTKAFYGYYAFDGTYDYWDYYYANMDRIVLEDSYKELISLSAKSYTSKVTRIGDYSFKIRYFGVSISNGIVCDETYYYRKLSDIVLTGFFRFLRERTVNLSEANSTQTSLTHASLTQQPDQSVQTVPNSVLAKQQPDQADQIAPDDSLVTQKAEQNEQNNIFLSQQLSATDMHDMPALAGSDKQSLLSGVASNPDNVNNKGTASDDSISNTLTENKSSIRNRNIFKIPSFRASIRNNGFSNK